MKTYPIYLLSILIGLGTLSSTAQANEPARPATIHCADAKLMRSGDFRKDIHRKRAQERMLRLQAAAKHRAKANAICIIKTKRHHHPHLHHKRPADFGALYLNCR
jgi:hypothetical protein